MLKNHKSTPMDNFRQSIALKTVIKTSDKTYYNRALYRQKMTFGIYLCARKFLTYYWDFIPTILFRRCMSYRHQKFVRTYLAIYRWTQSVRHFILVGNLIALNFGTSTDKMLPPIQVQMCTTDIFFSIMLSSNRRQLLSVQWYLHRWMCSHDSLD